MFTGLWKAALPALALLGSVTAQTQSECNPMEKSCAPNQALGTSAHFDWKNDGYDSKLFHQFGGRPEFTPYGAQFRIANRLDSPTIESNFYIFFGRVECVMRAAPGQGVVSTVTLLSDTLDEIDIEFVGGDQKHWQSNYFGKGDTSVYDRGGTHEIADPMSSYHNYTILWTKEKTEWFVDGSLIRTLTFDEAKGGTRYPQTPMQVKVGVWPGGDPGNQKGVIDWAGGEIDYKKGPYTMSVKSLNVQDYGSGKEYVYGDRSGSWESIESVEGESESYKRVHRPRGISAKWNALSTTARTAIIAGSVSAVALIMLVMAFVCFRQRRAGRAEFAQSNHMFAGSEDEVKLHPDPYAQKEYYGQAEHSGHPGGFGQPRY